MKTTRTYTAVAAMTALTLASIGFALRSAAASTDRRAFPATSALARSGPAKPRVLVDTPPRYEYGWPVKPFHEQHPVRGFFGDPRIANHHQSRQFHFGVDVSAPDGTAVYATLTGTAYLHALHENVVVVIGRAGVEFSYWHVVPTIHNGQRAVAYETVIGHVLEGQDHVHFSELRGGRYVNPLRPGAMGPFVDHTRPITSNITSELSGRRTDPVAGRAFDLVAQVADETPLPVPRPWHDLPVMPALVRWHLLDSAGQEAIAWRTVVDFRLTIPPASEYDATWAPGATQNHVRMPAKYRLYLARNIADLAPGTYTVEVAARDTRSNRSVTRVPLVVR